jgi:hypothetical protein
VTVAEIIGEGDGQVLHALGRPKKKCNRHDDCDAEDEVRAALGRPKAEGVPLLDRGL